jgi:hypothetical protein
MASSGGAKKQGFNILATRNGILGHLMEFGQGFEFQIRIQP